MGIPLTYRQQDAELMSRLSTRPPWRKIFEPNPASGPQRVPRGGHPPHKLAIVLEAIVEPVVFIFESDQHASRFSVARDNNFPRRRKAQKSRQVVLEFSQSDLADRAFRDRGASATLRLL